MKIETLIVEHKTGIEEFIVTYHNDGSYTVIPKPANELDQSE